MNQLLHNTIPCPLSTPTTLDRFVIASYIIISLGFLSVFFFFEKLVCLWADHHENTFAVIVSLIHTDFVWFGLVWFGLVWFGLVWFGFITPTQLLRAEQILQYMLELSPFMREGVAATMIQDDYVKQLIAAFRSLEQAGCALALCVFWSYTWKIVVVMELLSC
jgi:hypothetical protein